MPSLGERSKGHLLMTRIKDIKGHSQKKGEFIFNLTNLCSSPIYTALQEGISSDHLTKVMNSSNSALPPAP